MKALQKTLIAVAMVVGLSIAVSAQKHDNPKKPPPKDPPPVVNPNVKPPKGDDRPPKKPRASVLALPKEILTELV
jgi:hypothetical protein